MSTVRLIVAWLSCWLLWSRIGLFLVRSGQKNELVRRKYGKIDTNTTFIVLHIINPLSDPWLTKKPTITKTNQPNHHTNDKPTITTPKNHITNINTPISLVPNFTNNNLIKSLQIEPSHIQWYNPPKLQKEPEPFPRVNIYHNKNLPHVLSNIDRNSYGPISMGVFNAK